MQEEITGFEADEEVSNLNETPAIIPKNETIEQKAAREIIENLKKDNSKDETKVFTLPVKPDELILDGAKESSMDDYESIPIADYGLAMLRGMGWKDESKKDAKLKTPALRPKGMGLGADKVAKPKPALIAPAPDEVLEMKKGASVKVIAGKSKDMYGQVSFFLFLIFFILQITIRNGITYNSTHSFPVFNLSLFSFKFCNRIFLLCGFQFTKF